MVKAHLWHVDPLQNGHEREQVAKSLTLEKRGHLNESMEELGSLQSITGSDHTQGHCLGQVEVPVVQFLPKLLSIRIS